MVLAMAMDTASTTARGRLRPSPRLMLILTFSMVAMLDIMAMLDTPTPPTDTASTTARGRLRLMLRPSLTTMVPMVLDMVVFMAMVLAMATDTASTTARGRLRPRLSPTTMAVMDIPVPTMVATAAMAVDTTGDKSSDHISP